MKLVGVLFFLTTIAFCNFSAAGSELAKTAIQYKFFLTQDGEPANGVFDLQFTLHNTSSGRGIIAGPVTNRMVKANGGAVVTRLDFGLKVPVSGYWLTVAWRTNGGQSFIPLAFRDELTSANSTAATASLPENSLATPGPKAASVEEGRIALREPKDKLGPTARGKQAIANTVEAAVPRSAHPTVHFEQTSLLLDFDGVETQGPDLLQVGGDDLGVAVKEIATRPEFSDISLDLGTSTKAIATLDSDSTVTALGETGESSAKLVWQGDPSNAAHDVNPEILQLIDAATAARPISPWRRRGAPGTSALGSEVR